MLLSGIWDVGFTMSVAFLWNQIELSLQENPLSLVHFPPLGQVAAEAGYQSKWKLTKLPNTVCTTLL